jgi:hypothetical protein
MLTLNDTHLENFMENVNMKRESYDFATGKKKEVSGSSKVISRMDPLRTVSANELTEDEQH